MVKRLKLLLLSAILLCLLPMSLFAQLPSARYTGKESLKTNLKMLNKRYGVLSIAGGYQCSNLLNPVFVANLGTGYVRTTGFYIGGRITLYPVLLDVQHFKDYFQVKALSGIEEDEIITHRGWDFSLSTALLPYGKLASILMPYAGIGYQLSQLCLHCKQTENDSDDLEVPFNALPTSSPFWKTGLAVSYKSLRLEAEFKQTLSLGDSHALNTWRIGLGWTPPSFKSLQSK